MTGFRLPDSVAVVHAPTDPVATPQELAAYLGDAGLATAQEALLTDMVAAAEERVVGVTGITGRCFRPTTLRAVFDAGAPDDRPFRIVGGAPNDEPVLRMVGSDGQPDGTAPSLEWMRLLEGRWVFKPAFESGPGLRMEASYTVGDGTVPAVVKQAVLKVGAWMYRDRDPTKRAMPLDWDDLGSLLRPWKKV